MHVKGELSLSLEAFLLWRHLAESLNHNTLRKQLFLSTTAADFLKGGLSFVDKSGPESTKTNLDKSSVEQYLAVDIERADGLLQVRHQHHIACLVVIIMEGKEVNLAQHSASTDDALAVYEEVVA